MVCTFLYTTKGQLKSEWVYEVLIFHLAMKSMISALKFFTYVCHCVKI